VDAPYSIRVSACPLQVSTVCKPAQAALGAIGLKADDGT